MFEVAHSHAPQLNLKVPSEEVFIDFQLMMFTVQVSGSAWDVIKV
jgi:hypothetical protein